VLLAVGKVRGTREPFRWPKFEMFASGVAFAAWALALPQTPLLSICSYKSDVGAFIVTAVTVSIGVLAFALGKQPPTAALAPAPAPAPTGAAGHPAHG